jgi:hypothetical protein
LGASSSSSSSSSSSPSAAWPCKSVRAELCEKVGITTGSHPLRHALSPSYSCLLTSTTRFQMERTSPDPFCCASSSNRRANLSQNGRATPPAADYSCQGFPLLRVQCIGQSPFAALVLHPLWAPLDNQHVCDCLHFFRTYSCLCACDPDVVIQVQELHLVDHVQVT